MRLWRGLVVVSSVTLGLCLPVRAAALADALSFLTNEMDRFHRAVDVYTDLSAPGNHFLVPARIDGVGADPASDMRLDWAEDCRRGSTCVLAESSATTGWAGWYFLNGVLTDAAPAPQENWGTVPAGGVDLTGVAALTFWAKGLRGGERIEFFVAGVGRDAFSGVPLASHPGSSPRYPAPRSVVTLTDGWRHYAIDVTGLDLSYVLGGFGWAMSTELNPAGASFLLDDIRFEYPEGSPHLERRLDAPRFIRSYTTLGPSDDLDTAFRNVGFVYDNAIAALAFMAGGGKDGRRRAELICDALVYASDHDRFYADGGLRDAYHAGELIQPPGWNVNGRAASVRLPGYVEGGSWVEDRLQVSRHTGNTAWAAIALLTYHEAWDKPEYLAAALRLGTWLAVQREERGFGGYLGGFEGREVGTADFPDDPRRVSWSSTEHNIDVAIVFRKLFSLTGDPVWRDHAQHAEAFVTAMWDASQTCFRTGTYDPFALNGDVLPLDPQSWSYLALTDRRDVFARSLACAARELSLVHHGYAGFDFGKRRNEPGEPDGVWFEGSAQMALAYKSAGRSRDAERLLADIRRAQARGASGAGGIVASCHDTVSTGFGDGYYVRPHIAATGWYVLAELGCNPFALVEPAGNGVRPEAVPHRASGLRRRTCNGADSHRTRTSP